MFAPLLEDRDRRSAVRVEVLWAIDKQLILQLISSTMRAFLEVRVALQDCAQAQNKLVEK